MAGEVALQPGLELVQHQFQFGLVPLAIGRDFGIDDRRAGLAHHLDRAFHRGGGVRVDRELAAQHADARALQSVRFQPRVIVEGDVPGRVGGGRIGGVATGQCRQQQRRVRHAAGHRSGGVLAERDRDDAVAADQADRRLQPDHAADRGRADDAAVGFGADAGGGEVGRNGDRAAGTGAAGIAIQHVGIAGLAAAGAPSGSGMGGTEVRPFAQVGLAQDDRAGLAQALDQEGVAGGPEILQRQRTGRVDHRGGVDVVLEQDRDAVQRAAHRVVLALEIAQGRFLHGVGVDFDDRVQLRPGLVDRGDAVQVGAGEGAAVEFAALHASLQVVDVQFGVGEVRRRVGGRVGDGGGLALAGGQHQGG